MQNLPPSSPPQNHVLIVVYMINTKFNRFQKVKIEIANTKQLKLYFKFMQN